MATKNTFELDHEAFERILDYAHLDILTPANCGAVYARLQGAYDRRMEDIGLTSGWHAAPKITGQDVDNALLPEFGYADDGHGYACKWFFGQEPGPAWAGVPKARNSRGVSFRPGNRVTRILPGGHKQSGRVMGIEPGKGDIGTRLVVREQSTDWDLLWNPEECRLN